MHTFGRPLAALILATLAAAPLGARADNAYQTMRDEVYAHPDRELPCYPGLPLSSFVRTLLGLGGDLVKRELSTFHDKSNTKTLRPKKLHPNGVCADATWTITGTSTATGLLSAGTSVPSLVRFSTADGRTLYEPGKNRIFGMAVKLFPNGAPSTNILTLGENGQTGADRVHFLAPSDKGESIYFANQALGGGTPNKILGWAFKRVDKNPVFQPLRETVGVNADGSKVADPESPGLIRLVPNLSHARGIHTEPDFRSEILDYGAGEIRFDVELTSGQKIGELVIGKPVASEVCDKKLTFHHTLN